MINEKELEETLFTFLNKKYVQVVDARQKSMGLQYTTAETHDLSKELARFIHKLCKQEII
jgi:hypothetical protein